LHHNVGQGLGFGLAHVAGHGFWHEHVVFAVHLIVSQPKQ